MELGWKLVLGFGALVLALGIAALLVRPVINLIVDAFVKRLLKDPYPENLGEMYNVFAKVGLQNVLESDLRANHGEILQRPFGSPIHFSPWRDLLFNPVYLCRFPVEESVKITTEVTLGPRAKRPMEIAMPIMIGGMAYGLGPSLQAKIALAKAADMVNTATNTGVGPFLPEERKHVKRLIIQYHRGDWSKEEEVLRQADMVEIQLGYGALGSAPVTAKASDLSPEFKSYMKLGPEEELKLGASFPNVKNGKDLAKLVKELRTTTNGVPIGVKIGATHYLERELEIITGAEIDFLCIDGAEAGINFGPEILTDSLGLPTLTALCRTIKYLEAKQLKNDISLIISGGLVTPGQFLKAIALGADAVYIGTIAMIVLAHKQITKALPWEPPTELVYERGKLKDRLNVEESAKGMANFLTSCQLEMITAMRTLGHTKLKDLSLKDLTALTAEVSDMTGVELGLFPPGSAQKRS